MPVGSRKKQKREDSDNEEVAILKQNTVGMSENLHGQLCPMPSGNRAFASRRYEQTSENLKLMKIRRPLIKTTCPSTVTLKFDVIEYYLHPKLNSTYFFPIHENELSGKGIFREEESCE